MNVRAMLDSISYSQLVEWYEYSRLEPFGEERSDYRTAHIVATLMNINRDPKKSKAVSVEDCLLMFGDRKRVKRKQTWQEQKSIAMLWAAALAGE